MRVGVIDVGANTLRLLVAESDGSGGVVGVHTTRVELGLGEDVETRGAISSEKLAGAERAAGREARVARRRGCDVVEIVVTSPGRQAENARELLDALGRVTGASVRVLSAEDEAGYAFEGALACTPGMPDHVAVVDVGGGSTQIVVGSRGSGPEWTRSLDLGSLRLTRRAFTVDPPQAAEVEAAERIVEELFTDLVPPTPTGALATGGSARAVRRIVGAILEADELALAISVASKTSSRRLVRDYGVSPRRARTLLAGALLLAEAQRSLGAPLVVARGGLREGVAARLLRTHAAAAA